VAGKLAIASLCQGHPLCSFCSDTLPLTGTWMASHPSHWRPFLFIGHAITVITDSCLAHWFYLCFFPLLHICLDISLAIFPLSPQGNIFCPVSLYSQLAPMPGLLPLNPQQQLGQDPCVPDSSTCPLRQRWKRQRAWLDFFLDPDHIPSGIHSLQSLLSTMFCVYSKILVPVDHLRAKGFVPPYQRLTGCFLSVA
jgi:hypothetical protein